MWLFGYSERKLTACALGMLVIALSGKLDGNLSASLSALAATVLILVLHLSTKRPPGRRDWPDDFG